MTELTDSSAPDDLRAFALTKIANVLGAERAQRIVEELVDRQGAELRTPDELLGLAERMTPLGGFEAAVGAMLGVAAILRGARPRSSPDGT